MRTDVYQKITDRIVAELEQGVRPWKEACLLRRAQC
jgi:antirestriction protein ArdC